MRGKVVGLVCVLAISFGIILYKHTLAGATEPEAAKPWVLLVADLREAEDECPCGEIIRAVRALKADGIKTEELTPNSDSPLLAKYRVLSAPTVIIFSGNGQEKVRFEGEDEKTVKALKEQLAKLKEG